MPTYKQADSLKQMCFMLLAKDIHKIAVDLEENREPKYMKKSLNSLIESLPTLFIEQMITKVIETIHNNVQRSRRTIGLQTCLEVLLQPNISRLDLSALFFKMRLPSKINSGIRNVVTQKITSMKYLTYINLVSKCDDEVLLTISKYCPHILEVVISLSELVTDKGIEHLSKGCPVLERLEIYKCWAVSPLGVRNVLINAGNLRELHYDNLGNVFLQYLQGTHKVFKLKHFEQTYTPFEIRQEEASWIGSVCPEIQSVRLFIDNEFMYCIPVLGKLRVLELEVASLVGDGFNLAIAELASTLTTLHLSCEFVERSHIMTIGKSCKHLTTFHLTTATIKDDENLKNSGEYFVNLTSLHLQIWKEVEVREECINFFLLWCHNLSYIVVKAQMNFFTDSFLRKILAVNKFEKVAKIIITSDRYVPLTVRSARRLIEQCPLLEALCISSWDVSEEEFFDLVTTVKESNYSFSVT